VLFSDPYGRKLVFQPAIGFFTVASALAGLSWTMPVSVLIVRNVGALRESPPPVP